MISRWTAADVCTSLHVASAATDDTLALSVSEFPSDAAVAKSFGAHGRHFLLSHACKTSPVL